MDTDEVQKYVRATGAVVCASDEIPQIRINGGMYISNTEELDKSGSHWVLLAVLPGERLIYFDPLSVPPLTMYFYNFLNCNKDGRTLEMNKNVLQSGDSVACGKWCILIAWYLFKGGELYNFCKMYSASPYLNDKKMEGHWALFLKWYKRESAAK